MLGGSDEWGIGWTAHQFEVAAPASHQEQMVAVDHREEGPWQLGVAASADLPWCQYQGLQAGPRRAELALGAAEEECLKPQQEMQKAWTEPSYSQLCSQSKRV